MFVTHSMLHLHFSGNWFFNNFEWEAEKLNVEAINKEDINIKQVWLATDNS